VAAACIMGVEILSTRLVARYLGASLYTWTSAIGVVLAGISFGNYLGGHIADRYRPRQTLSILFICASALVALIPMVSTWLGEWSALDVFSWPTHVFLHFLIVFLLPATMLGTMSPVVAKMALDVGLGPGRTVGTIYAWSSIGSIAGTFVAGFFLVAWAGTESSVLIIAGVLALMGLAYSFSWISSTWAAVFATALLALHLPWWGNESFASVTGIKDPDTWRSVFIKDSHYQRVKVLDVGLDRRVMQLDKLTHSKVNFNDPLELMYEYAAIYAEITRVARPLGNPPRALIIGGGGYVFPRYLEISYPGSAIEVIEIDPVVTQAAFETFNVPSDTAIRSINLDARNRVTDLVSNKRKGDATVEFDLIYGDVVNDLSVPFHLTTVEFYRLLYELLSDDGTYIVNLIDTLDSGRFLGAVIATCREVFPQVDVMMPRARPHSQNTFIVACSKRALDLSGVARSIASRHGYAARLLPRSKVDELVERNTGGLVLSDDYAPVENLLAHIVKRYERGESPEAEQTFRVAELFRATKLDDVIALSEEMLTEDPNAKLAHFWRGLALLRQDKPQEAISDFQAELEINPTHMRAHASLGLALEALDKPVLATKAYGNALKLMPRDASARTYLARALDSAGRPEEAIKEYKEVIRLHPGFTRAQVELGRLLYRIEQFAESASLFESAAKLDPDIPQLRSDLALALIATDRAGDAVESLRLMARQSPDSPELHLHLGRALARSGNVAEAVTQFARSVELAPSQPSYRANLGLALEASGRLSEATVQYRESLNLNPRNPALINALSRLLATSTDATVRDGDEAVRLAERLVRMGGANNPGALDTLSAAYAEAGRFREATTVARQAAEIAEDRNQAVLARAIRGRVALYEAGQGYRVAGRWTVE